MKLKGFVLHILLNTIAISVILYTLVVHSEELNVVNFLLICMIIYLCFLYVSGVLKAIKEYFVITRGEKIHGHVDGFIYGIRILGMAGYYPIISYEEHGRKVSIKYKSYRAMKKENHSIITIYKWKNLVVPLEFSEWSLK